MNDIKYKYALDEQNNVISISSINAVNFKNNYICPSCNKKLRPRIGNIRVHHFYHPHKNDVYSCSIESYLHTISKKLLYEKLIKLFNEKKSYIVNIYNKIIVFDTSGKVIKTEISKEKSPYDILNNSVKIYLEKVIGEYKPDILIEYVNIEPLFLEIKVTHKSSIKKIINNRIIEINITEEADIRRILNHLDENKDELINFDKYRKIIEKYISTVSEIPKQNVTEEIKKQVIKIERKITYSEKKEILTKICEDFNKHALVLSVKYVFDKILGGNYRERITTIFLSDFYSSIKIIEKDAIYCELANIDNKKLIIGFSDLNKEVYKNNLYVILYEKNTFYQILDSVNVMKNNVVIDFNNFNDNYIFKISCFMPKGHYSSIIKEFKYSEFIKLINKNEIELINIECIRKLQNI